MKYTLILSPRAMYDLQKIKKSGDTARVRKLKRILEELCEHPLTGTGNPEKLKYRIDTYSRRISQKDRVVYSIHDRTVQIDILQMLGHYDCK